MILTNVYIIKTHFLKAYNVVTFGNFPKFKILNDLSHIPVIKNPVNKQVFANNSSFRFCFLPQNNFCNSKKARSISEKQVSLHMSVPQKRQSQQEKEIRSSQ